MEESPHKFSDDSSSRGDFMFHDWSKIERAARLLCCPIIIGSAVKVEYFSPWRRNFSSSSVAIPQNTTLRNTDRTILLAITENVSCFFAFDVRWLLFSVIRLVILCNGPFFNAADTPFLNLKLNEIPSWFSRRQKTPQAFAAACSRGVYLIPEQKRDRSINKKSCITLRSLIIYNFENNNIRKEPPS